MAYETVRSGEVGGTGGGPAEPHAGPLFAGQTRVPAAPRTWFLGFVLLFVVLRAPLWIDTSNPDPMAFAYVGQVIADGGRPYIDAWDNKPPGVYLANAVPLFVAPFRLEGIFLLETIWILVAAWVTYRLGEAVGGMPAGKWTLFLFVFSMGVGELAGSANMTEAYALLPAAVGYVCFYRAWERDAVSRLGLLTCGAMFGIAMQFRVPAVLPLVALTGGLLWLSPGRRPGSRRVSAALWPWAGFALVCSLVGAALSFRGVLRAYVETVWLANFIYVADAGSLPLSRILKVFTRTGPAMALGLIGMVAALRGKDPRLKILSLCLLADFAGALISRHWYSHYFIQPMVPASILGGWFLGARVRSLIESLGRFGANALRRDKPAALAVGGFLLLLGVGLICQVGYVLELRGELADGDSRLRTQWEAAQYIRATTASQDLLVCHGFGAITGLYVLSQRRAASEHFHTHCVAGEYFGAGSPWVEPAAKAYLGDLHRQAPELVVFHPGRRIRIIPEYADDFVAWLEGGYHFDRRIGDYELWRRSR